MLDWLFGKKKEEEKKPEKGFFILFDPQTDITAYELATMHMYVPGFWDGMDSWFHNQGLHMACYAVIGENNLRCWREMPSSIRRHFRIVDDPTIKIEDGDYYG